MFKNALVSVSDKTGLVEFLKPLAEQGLRIVSTGGTAQHLKQAGLKVVDVSEQTGFPEVMNGRVKTLHPKVHMGLLARDIPEDLAVLKQNGIDAFDLVIVNLYPFEKTLIEKWKGANLSDADMIEKIDVGGPSMIRAAAKSFQRISVVSDPRDYQWLAAKEKVTDEDRRILAAKAFAHCARYDSLISHYMGAFWGDETSFGGTKVQDLRYGENPQQRATWYQFSGDIEGLHTAEILQGKTLSYNNILDLDAASFLLQNLDEKSAVVVKHNNPCGAGTGDTLTEGLKRALDADPVSAFGGIVALGGQVTALEADLLKNLFLECIVAPSFAPEALEIFKTKKNLRLLSWPQIFKAKRFFELKSVAGGFLVQSADNLQMGTDGWQFLGEQPSPEILRDLIFAEKVCASLKSNAIAIVSQGQTLGLGMGQVNRVDAVAQAIERMRTHHAGKGTPVLASDAFFPFPDSIEKLAQAGIRWVIQPGGSVKDQDVFQAARDLKVNLVITGRRHFRH
ncbi:MAG: bifunctional phosphoribosylaminoimidazolecarboxamide formyltransferase/IMP cyclohydrolase [Bdellovibrionaceae bacterium]|nr:bifunctional phosphoribosylaminoimidazolecarboxamide formyltransferase/IMP cyclohydrolase [Pseudobdellovibrionaceae bacterium]